MDDAFINRIFDGRPWESPEVRIDDPLEFGISANIPTHRARVKLIGIEPKDAYRALAARLWLIEQAEHKVDIAYYIFKRDLVGYALIGALCDAVQRGVDVRVVIDSVGSLHPTHSELKALETCADDAGYMRNAAGQTTKRRARVQVVIFNPVSAVFRKMFNALRNVPREQPAVADRETTVPIRNWGNRRMHDKLLVVDRFFPDRTAVITGGRNISLSYYGFDREGKPDPKSYLDMDILLRMEPDDLDANPHLGSIAETYFHLLFSHLGNKRLEPNPLAAGLGVYRRQIAKARQSLAEVKGFAAMQRRVDMPVYMSQGFYPAGVRLGHELANLLNRNVVTNLAENRFPNPNSIMHLIQLLGEEAKGGDVTRIVSPYLFLTKYESPDGQLVVDEYDNINGWLQEDPKRRLEIVTNSVLTSDNLLAQSIIDMDMGPRLILSDDYREAWLSNPTAGEHRSELVQSPEWRRMIEHLQIFLYQTGRLDSNLLREDGVVYGKLHAKFLSDEAIGFVGTSNFDYRSRLLNSEMGYFFTGDTILDDLHRDFERLKQSSYRWGSPEWLEMREQYRSRGGLKGYLSGWQRPIYKLMRGLYLEWLI